MTSKLSNETHPPDKRGVLSRLLDPLVGEPPSLSPEELRRDRNAQAMREARKAARRSLVAFDQVAEVDEEEARRLFETVLLRHARLLLMALRTDIDAEEKPLPANLDAALSEVDALGGGKVLEQLAFEREKRSLPCLSRNGRTLHDQTENRVAPYLSPSSPTRSYRRKRRIVVGFVGMGLGALLWLGVGWWVATAAEREGYVYRHNGGPGWAPVAPNREFPDTLVKRIPPENATLIRAVYKGFYPRRETGQAALAIPEPYARSYEDRWIKITIELRRPSTTQGKSVLIGYGAEERSEVHWFRVRPPRDYEELTIIARPEAGDRYLSILPDPEGVGPQMATLVRRVVIEPITEKGSPLTEEEIRENVSVGFQLEEPGAPES